MTIRTDHKWHAFKYFMDLTEKQKAELDWIDDDCAPVLVYKGWPFALDQFMRIEHSSELKDWHGIHNDTFFSGVLIRLSDDGEKYQIATYFG